MSPEQSTLLNNSPSLSKGESQSLQKILKSEKGTEAEILWTLHCVTETHHLDELQELYPFKNIFPDCDIVKDDSTTKKIAYFSIYGLVPYFSNQLREEYK
ncbi:hypothetical protein CEXT_795941 [Caerostris extrusa]|uniref:Uncharacterized protein n=1 Tax=Caerostris extrusa TaxID=172846 RepID=A0AAV4RAQ6_CAEEX|nr:hypothetical protein CEXT_795941 [Caerostris extrusa]